MSVSAHSPMPSRRRLSHRSTLAYGLGSIAYGIKDNGFQTFLLLFYNQVMGLSAVSVGTVIMLALLADAFVDPIIGAASDRTSTRWGRRHPWMYASALPISVGWLLLWNPPAMSHAAMLGWVFVSAIIVRSAVSAYEVPSAALAPELSADYDERTRIIAYRYVFGWAGGLSMLIAAYMLFLVPAPGQPNGLLNRAGYHAYATTGAIGMFLAILISAWGTHREIRHLPRPVVHRVPLRQVGVELIQTMKNKAFVVLMVSGLFAYVAQGISFALSNYFYTFVWHFAGTQLLLLAGVLMVGVIIAFAIAAPLSARFGKRQVGAAGAALASVLLIMPYLLRFAGLFPEPGDPKLLPLFSMFIVANIAFGVSSMMIGGSMMADIVEQSEISTGRRSEGVFSAGNFFVQKCSSGIGIFLAGTILSVAGFPEEATPGTVPAATIDRLTIIFCVSSLALSLIAACFYWRFPFGREEHDARLRELNVS